MRGKKGEITQWVLPERQKSENYLNTFDNVSNEDLTSWASHKKVKRLSLAGETVVFVLTQTPSTASRPSYTVCLSGMRNTA